MVLAQGTEVPPDDEAASYLEALELYVNAMIAPKLLVVTEGAAPGPAIRKRVDRILEPHKSTMRVAIVTRSTFARGVLKAIRLLSPFYQGFEPGDMEAALRFLKVPPSQFADIMRSTNELRAELGLPPLSA